MSSIESGSVRPPHPTTFEPVEAGITSKTSRVSPEGMKALRELMAQESSNQAQLQKPTHPLNQATLDYASENAKQLAEAVTDIGAAAANQKFATQPLPVKNEDATGVTLAVVDGILSTGLSVLMAIVKEQPSAHIRNAGPYAQAENALDAGIEGAKKLISELDPKAAGVAGPVLTGIEDIVGSSLNIADVVSQKGDTASMASSIMLALAGVTKGITEIVTATAGKEVAGRVSSVLDTVGKGLEVAADGIKPGADPFDTAIKAATTAFDQAGKIASTVKGETSAKVAAILPHVGIITEGVLGMASDGVKGTADVAGTLQRLGNVIAGTQGLVAASTNNGQVADIASRALQPVSNGIVIMKQDDTIVTMSEQQANMSEAKNNTQEMEAKMQEVKGEMSKAEQKAAKDKAVINAAVQGFAAGLGAAAAVGGAAMAVKGNSTTNTALEKNQAQLSSLQERKAVLNEHLQGGAKPLSDEQITAKKLRIAELKAESQSKLTAQEQTELTTLQGNQAKTPEQNAGMAQLEAQAKNSLDADKKTELTKLEHEVEVRQMTHAQGGAEQQRIKAEMKELETQRDQIMRENQSSMKAQAGNVLMGSSQPLNQIVAGIGGTVTAQQEVEEQKARAGKEASDQLAQNARNMQEDLNKNQQKFQDVVAQHISSRTSLMQSIKM